MNLGRSVRDTLLVAAFEVNRAVRTWRALALILLYVIANVGGAYIFTEALAAIEQSVASSMGVATTRWPGALSEQVRQSEQLTTVLTGFVGDEALVDHIRAYPFLAVFALWQGMLFVPFLAATAASEAIALDLRSRALRYEALRAGRAEILLGRFAGQLLLAGVAMAASLVGVWTLGVTLSSDPQPLGLAWGLMTLSSRAWCLAVPFVGLGIACSAWTTSPAWARVMALGMTAASWVLYGLTAATWEGAWGIVFDAIAPLVPQTWIEGLWHADADLAMSGVMMVALAGAAVGVGFARFAGRDL